MAQDIEEEIKLEEIEGDENPNVVDAGRNSYSGKYIRADKIDFKSWDWLLSRLWYKQKVLAQKQEWEIDLSKLDIEDVITHGAYGTVYRGFFEGREVAVKLLLDCGEDGFLGAADAETCFEQEVAVWHKLDHPNVTKFIGASMGIRNLKIPLEDPSDDWHNCLLSLAYCVVVEYVSSETLKQYLIRNMRKKLALKVVVQLALDLARGLSYLHSQKIVHRDVKTENILVDPNLTLKIADFGVARLEAQNPVEMTRNTGTLGYMAPEVLDGKPYNRKCDVYSFGICLWEIYCCDMPFINRSFSEISYAVVQQNLRPTIPKCCPRSLASIMTKCWDANPDKRPEMDEVVRLLEAVDTSRCGGMIPEDKPFRCFCFRPSRGS